MPPTLVLFDVDGTLVDSAGAGRRGLESAFRSVFGVEDMNGPASRVRFHGMTDPAILAALAREAGIDPAEFDRHGTALVDAYYEGLAADLAVPDPRRRVLPGVRELLDALRGLPNVRVGLLTGNLERGARLKLDALGLWEAFEDGGFASDASDRSEIARIAWEKMCRRSGTAFERDRTFVVGDTELDVLCAKANGFRAVAVGSGWVARERLEAVGPDALFDDLTDLPAVLLALGLDGAARPSPR